MTIMRNRNQRDNDRRPPVFKGAQYTDFPVVKESIELMDFLMKKGSMSRNKVKTLLTHRAILVDKKITTQYNFMLQPGMLVQMSKKHKFTEFRSQQLKIVYEDAYIIVVDKREGVPSISMGKSKERTAHHILSEYVQRASRGNSVYIVHRLDREASGLMLFVKSEKLKKKMQDNWSRFVSEHRYVAVVAGEVEQDRGVVSSWMDEKGMLRSSFYLPMRNQDNAAVTYYDTVKRASGRSLVELTPETALRSQVRVHMQYLNHPIIGDAGKADDVVASGRLALHAFRLCFRHPVTGEPLCFDTPYPVEFRRLLVNRKDVSEDE